MTEETTPLSPRHERFVAEYLRDGNATQAYVRAGYSPRGAQPSASKLLRDPRIEAAVAAGRQRMGQALEVDVQRIVQEYAKIAFASVGDYVSTDADGRLHVDLEKAGQAQLAGIVELKIVNHRNQEQTVTLKLGKLQALAALTKQVGGLIAKPAPGLTAEDRERYEEQCAAYKRSLDHRDREYRLLQQELNDTRAALDAARLERPDHEKRDARQTDTAEATAPPVQSETPCASGPPDQTKAQSQRTVEPGMPTEPPPDLLPEAKFKWSGGREHNLGPDSADALRTMESTFPKR